MWKIYRKMIQTFSNATWIYKKKPTEACGLQVKK